MEEVGDALSKAIFTRNPPKSVGAQLNYLLRREGGSTKAVADRLGITPRSVQRYLKGDRKPAADVQKKLANEVHSKWQPRVRQRAVRQATGVMVNTRARFGYSAPIGTTDDPRVRHITIELPGDYVRQLEAARDENERREVIAQGLQNEYFQDRGSRAHGLGVKFTDIDYIDLELT